MRLPQKQSSTDVLQNGLQGLLQRDSNTGIFLWNFQNLQEHLFYRTPLVAASVAKTDQKKQKDITRKDTQLRIFLLKHNDAEKQK